jgi:DNA gyrase subunit A
MSDAEMPPDRIPVTIEDEMRSSYLAYAMSVIVSRALPDARDGLKPVHRRILYAAREGGFTPDKPYRKSARIVSDAMGKYHPHGDASIYDATVRLAQSWSMRVKLIDGQGNFGSVDGDSPAAMRYTEARLSRAAMFLLDDIDRDTVDFQPNYDENEQEPTVLPAAYPNLLINGSQGIAVGMATNIPTHNPTEIIDAALALIADPDLSLDDLMRIVPGPDFPTGGLILGRAGIRSAFETGRGSVVIRARAAIEEIRRERTAIVVTEIPYQVNKSTLLEKMAELVRAKTIEGVSDIRDESDRSGMRIVIELKRDATPEVVLNHLYRFTQLQTSFGVNMLALDRGQPRILSLKQALELFLVFREEVILRRSRHDLARNRERAHVLVGLAIAVDDIDEIIRIIRASPDAAAARAALMERDFASTGVEPLLALIDDVANTITNGRVKLTEAQARAILDLRLQRLTGLERDKIHADLNELAVKITDLLDIISSRPRRLEVIRDELATVREEIGTPRMTDIVDAVADQDEESLIEPGRMVVTITRDGFIKRTGLDVFRQQNRGGRGRTGAGRRGDDIITRSFIAHTHQWVLFFSSGGKAYREKVWRLPEAAPTAKGRALVNLLPELGTDQITTVLPLPQDESLWENLFLVFATATGNVRRNRLSDFRNVRASGLIAMKLDDNDRLIGVNTARDGQDVLLATRSGRCIRFHITDDNLRVFAGRDSSGVRGIRLADGDEVNSLCVLEHVEATAQERAAYLRMSAARRRAGDTADQPDELEAPGADLDLEDTALDPSADADMTAERIADLELREEILLTVTDGGFGKRSSAYDYRTTGRGGQGIVNVSLSPRTGKSSVATLPVQPGVDVMLVTDNGRLIRVPADQVRITARQALGVTLLKLDNSERVTSAFTVQEDPLEGPDEAPDEATDDPPEDTNA